MIREKSPNNAKHHKQEASILATTSIVQIILITPEQSSEDFLFWEYWDGLSKWMSVGSNLWHKLSESDNWHTQLAFTCSKSTTETLEKGVKHSSKLTIKTPERPQWQFDNENFTPFSTFYIVDFEQVDVSWEFI